MSSGIHTRGHIALHSKAGQPISMQQLICSLPRRPLLHLVQWGMRGRVKMERTISLKILPSSTHLLVSFHCIIL